jgi:hypothetical protein
VVPQAREFGSEVLPFAMYALRNRKFFVVGHPGISELIPGEMLPWAPVLADAGIHWMDGVRNSMNSFQPRETYPG